MPNLVKFRDDPDAMLVMSLEDYDEVTGKAAKAAIMHQDVVGPQPARHVRAERRGRAAGLPRPARHRSTCPSSPRSMQAPVRQIIAELGDLIYQDPETQAWQTADAYLSGNVRAKLAAAERAGAAYARNAEALRRCSPRTCCPATSTPTWARRGSRRPTSRPSPPTSSACRPTRCHIAHLQEGRRVERRAGPASAVRSVAATTDYGTARANGVWLLEQALNLKTPDHLRHVIERDGKEERVLNQEETLAAREKQKHIKERFRAWIFADPDRTERLVRLYNDTYNNLRLRLFDGSHLDFPGMNPHITLHPHQKDAVWRGMSSGNTLLAHAVGAGKTNVMVAAGHEDEAGRADQQAAVRRAQPHAGAVRPRVHAALPQRPAADRRQGGFHPRPPQAPDRQDRQRRVGRHHRHPQLLRAHRHVAATTRSSSCASRSPSTTSSCATAPPPTPPARTATSSRPSRSRKPSARSG